MGYNGVFPDEPLPGSSSSRAWGLGTAHGEIAPVFRPFPWSLGRYMGVHTERSLFWHEVLLGYDKLLFLGTNI